MSCATETAYVRTKPRWRGVTHQYAFFASLLTGGFLVLVAPNARAAVAAAIYAGSLAALLGTSALYHRVTWSPRARFWMARLDLAMIFVLISGSYTPVALALERPMATVVLWIAWGSAAAGIAVKVLWQAPPKWASAAVYVAVGSAGAFLMPEVTRSIGAGATTLLLAGGILYIAGAVVYALQRPDPSPAVFGYHEIFHAFVLAAATVHYVAMAVYLVPRVV